MSPSALRGSPTGPHRRHPQARPIRNPDRQQTPYRRGDHHNHCGCSGCLPRGNGLRAGQGRRAATHFRHHSQFLRRLRSRRRTPHHQAEFKLATNVLFDPVTIIDVATFAGINQAADNPNYGQGAKGYADRFGAGYADGAIDIMVGGAILPSLLHQDRATSTRAGAQTSHALCTHSPAHSSAGERTDGCGQSGHPALTRVSVATFYPEDAVKPGS
jgi:hypothetical protein